MSQADHHGNTPAAWTMTILALIGSTISGVALIVPSPILFWAGLAVIAVGAVVSGGMRMAGMGAIPARR